MLERIAEAMLYARAELYRPAQVLTSPVYGNVRSDFTYQPWNELLFRKNGISHHGLSMPSRPISRPRNCTRPSLASRNTSHPSGLTLRERARDLIMQWFDQI